MKKPSLVRRFFSILLRVVVVIAIMAGIALASFEGVTYYITGDLYDLRALAGTITRGGEDAAAEDTEAAAETVIDDSNLRNTLVFVDSADSDRQYIALNMLNTETYRMNILLIPSNAQVTVSREVLSELQKKMSDVKNTVSIRDVARSFGDDKYEMLTKVFESVTGLSISGYDIFSEKKFARLLDMAGTVEYESDRAISYRDEDGVLRVLDEDTTWYDSGDARVLLAYLDGSETEESARLERTSTYLQSFLSQLFEKNSASAIAKKYTDLVKTGGGREIDEEETIIGRLHYDDFAIRILQGSEADGVFTVDSEKVQVQVSALAKQIENASSSSGTTAAASTETTASSYDSKYCSIELYNAAYVSGLAGDWEAFLEEEGYSISLIDSYQDEGPLSTTRIIVAEEGMGEDLLDYFPGADISVGTNTTGADIQVYIGTDCTDVGRHAYSAEDDDTADGFDADTE